MGNGSNDQNDVDDGIYEDHGQENQPIDGDVDEYQKQINDSQNQRPGMPDAQLPNDQQVDNDGQENGNPNAFDDAEIKNLREIFDLFDKEQRGFIEVKDLETIMSSLQRDPNEVRDFIENLDPNSNGQITFEELLNLLQ